MRRAGQLLVEPREGCRRILLLEAGGGMGDEVDGVAGTLWEVLVEQLAHLCRFTPRHRVVDAVLAAGQGGQGDGGDEAADPEGEDATAVAFAPRGETGDHGEDSSGVGGWGVSLMSTPAGPAS